MHSPLRRLFPLLFGVAVCSGCHHLPSFLAPLPQDRQSGEAAAYTRESSAAKEPGPVPDGVADPVAKAVFVRNEEGGIDALHMDTGKRMWRTDQATLPLLVEGKHLYALAAEDKHWRPYVLLNAEKKYRYRPGEEDKKRIVRLDTEQKGKRVWQSEVMGDYDAGEGLSSRAQVAAWRKVSRLKEAASIMLRHQTDSWYWGGAVPTPDLLIPRFSITLAQLNLSSGTLEIVAEASGKRDDALPGPIEECSPRHVTKTEVVERGGRKITLAVRPGEDGDALVWSGRELATGKELPSREIFKASMWATNPRPGFIKRDYSAVIPHQSPHLFVLMDSTWYIYDIETGRQIGSCNTGFRGELPHVVGDRWFHVTEGDIDAAKSVRPRRLVCMSLRGRTAWEHPLLPKPWSLPPP